MKNEIELLASIETGGFARGYLPGALITTSYSKHFQNTVIKMFSLFGSSIFFGYLLLKVFVIWETIVFFSKYLRTYC